MLSLFAAFFLTSPTSTHAATQLYRGVNDHGDCFVELKINDIYPLRIDSTRYAGGAKTRYSYVQVNGFYGEAERAVLGKINQSFAPQRAFLGGLTAEIAASGSRRVRVPRPIQIEREIHISPNLHSPNTITFSEYESSVMGIFSSEIQSASCTNLMPLDALATARVMKRLTTYETY